MLRALALSVVLAAAAAPLAEAQQRAQPRSAASTAIETDLCTVTRIGFANDGIGFVCSQSGSPRYLVASAGGNRPGGVSALMSFLLDAESQAASNRGGINVRHIEPSSSAQRICDHLSVPGPTNRQPLTCRELVSAYN